ncbi:MAG TPA: F0F1 ATP synthase subunit delta [Candidatus Dormibacteraeota bacterium]|nr:F0F1 ATP synthase subunit delta [Candidatus Dormibacteraeota bacterium]
MAVSTAVARRYADAYFALAREGKDIDGWGKALRRSAEVLGNDEVTAALSNPRLNNSERARITLDLLRDEPAHVRNLARLLVERGRLAALPFIVDRYQQLADRASGVFRAEVTTAVEPSAGVKKQIAEMLEKQLGTSVTTEVKADPSILGGLVIRIGDRVIDDSVRTHLQQLQAALA